MTLLCKQKALYVKVCIIQNGVADYHGDILNSTDIKKIFTSFNNQNSFEIYHDEIPIQEVSLLENYISKSEEIIAGTTIPVGSWNAIIRVDNPTIQTKLLNNDFGGVSLNNRIKTECSTGLTGMIKYSDLKDAECVIPVYISFVEEPANLVGLHIMDYNVYIQKSKNGKENGEAKRMSLLEDLKALISKAEAEVETPISETTETEPVEIAKGAEDKEEEEVVEEVVEEETDEEATNEEATDEEQTEDEEEKPQIEKDGEEILEEELAIDEPKSVEDEISLLKSEIESIKEILNEIVTQNPIDVPIEEANPNEPIITKSAKIEVTNEVDVGVDFYERTGRDRLTGKKIRKQTKILN